ncbi:vasodilator-stimulated phosphoprotein-like isoform X3 [Lineus longissimus]|uniref:vasodilator-stimulated phosphoprotein-like isoform X3 n=1 Tax=Lineus longissimus TaxID=88925 RepID=UPI00315D388F
MPEAMDGSKDEIPSEHSIVAARASVMIYDDANKKWIPSGSSQGLSKVHIYYHSVNNTFRVVGRKLQDHEVVINCAILRGLKYNQATSTFHQWRDNRQVYGLNFTSKEDADKFAQAMCTALESLVGASPRPSQPIYQQPQIQQPPQGQPQHPPQHFQQNGPSETHVLPPQQVPQPPAAPEPEQRPPREDYQTHQRKSSQPTYRDQMIGTPQESQPSTLPTQTPPRSTPQVTSAPPAPPPAPPAPPAAPPAPAAPAPPPAPPLPAPASKTPTNTGGAPPPPAPPPPPPSGGVKKNDDEDSNTGGFAAALRTVQLKKTNKSESKDTVDNEKETRGHSRGPSIPGAGDMMSEMARLLAQRRRKTEGELDVDGSGSQSQNQTNAPTNTSTTPNSTEKRPWEKGNNNTSNGNKPNGSESPKVNRTSGTPTDEINLSCRTSSLTRSHSLAQNKRIMSLTNQEPIVNGAISSQDLEIMKQEIITEMRKEMQKMKEEIIRAVIQEKK